MRSYKAKELYPCFLVDILPTGNYLDIYKLNELFGYVIKSVSYKSRGPKQCYNCQGFLHPSDNCFFKPRCNKCAGDHHCTLCTVPKDQREHIKCVNCGDNLVANWKGCPKNSRNIQKLDPNPKNNFNSKPRISKTNSIVKEGTSFADVSKSSPQTRN